MHKSSPACAGCHQLIDPIGFGLEKFDAINSRLYDAGWRAQFISGLIMPLLSFVSNIGYVFVAVLGGIMVTQRAITIGDVQAFIQYSRQFSRAK